jgi:hypothetical protein
VSIGITIWYGYSIGGDDDWMFDEMLPGDDYEIEYPWWANRYDFSGSLEARITSVMGEGHGIEVDLGTYQDGWESSWMLGFKLADESDTELHLTSEVLYQLDYVHMAKAEALARALKELELTPYPYKQPRILISATQF